LKKFVSIILCVLLIASVCCGCETKTLVESKSAQTETSVTEQDIEPIVTATIAEPTEPKMIEDENTVANNTESNESEDESEEQVELVAMWEPQGKIEFQIDGETYAIGDTCSNILSMFEIIEISDGHVRDDGTVPVCEKITIWLRDSYGHFCIEIRNDMNQPIPMEECVLHAILVESEFYDLNNLLVEGREIGTYKLDDLIEAFGDDYTDYEHGTQITHSWKYRSKCWIDVCCDAETGDMSYVQLMTY
jgi:hypothetical protein